MTSDSQRRQIRYFVDSSDKEAWEIARQLRHTSVEVTVSKTDPALWVDGVCYRGLDRIREKVAELIDEEE